MLNNTSNSNNTFYNYQFNLYSNFNCEYNKIKLFNNNNNTNNMITSSNSSNNVVGMMPSDIPSFYAFDSQTQASPNLYNRCTNRSGSLNSSASSCNSNNTSHKQEDATANQLDLLRPPSAFISRDKIRRTIIIANSNSNPISNTNGNYVDDYSGMEITNIDSITKSKENRDVDTDLMDNVSVSTPSLSLNNNNNSDNLNNNRLSTKTTTLTIDSTNYPTNNNVHHHKEQNQASLMLPTSSVIGHDTNKANYNNHDFLSSVKQKTISKNNLDEKNKLDSKKPTEISTNPLNNNDQGKDSEIKIKQTHLSNTFFNDNDIDDYFRKRREQIQTSKPSRSERPLVNANPYNNIIMSTTNLNEKKQEEKGHNNGYGKIKNKRYNCSCNLM